MIGYCSRSSVERTSNIPHKLRYFLLNQQKLLLVDAVGAAVTAFANFFLLGAELIKTGMPVGLLHSMAIVAACFVCFDLVAFNRCVDPATALRIVACLNLSYCIFVIASLYVHRSVVTRLGFTYFCIEIAIVISLAAWEWTVAYRCQRGRTH